MELTGVNRLQSFLLGLRGTRSFSQCGEDLIMAFVLRSLGIQKPRYLDIGAHDPIHYSNTFFFYRQGASGVCVEPDPRLCKQISRVRTRDTCLNVGVADQDDQVATFYVLSSPTLSTFSKTDVDRYLSYGRQKIVEELSIPCVSVNTILKTYFDAAPPDLVSIDVEGYDLEVLQSWNFEQFLPAVICAETLTYTEDKSEQKIDEIINLLTNQDYILWADTYINSIFVDRARWKHR